MGILQSKPKTQKITLLLFSLSQCDAQNIIYILKNLDGSHLANSQKMPINDNPNDESFYFYDRFFEIKIYDKSKKLDIPYDIAIMCYNKLSDSNDTINYINNCYAVTNNFANATYHKNILLSYHKTSYNTEDTIRKEKEINNVLDKSKLVSVYSYMGDKFSFENVLGSAINIANDKM